MYLYVIDQKTFKIKAHITMYSFIQYEDELNGSGSFQITVPVSDEPSLQKMNYNDYILFEEGICGIVKGKSDSQDEMEEYNITGVLSNDILNWRSLLLTTDLKGKITTVAHKLLNDNFISPSNEDRKTDIIFLTDYPLYYPTDETVPEIDSQETGLTVLETINKMYLVNEYGFECYPMIVDFGENVDYNMGGFMFRTLKPNYRTVDNENNLNPIVFSFELNNVSRLEHEEDGLELRTVAIVAGPGEGKDRKIVEVSNPYCDYNEQRMELYVDARDIQNEVEDEEGNKVTITDEELEQKLAVRGLEKLLECQIFHTFDGGVIVEGDSRYKYRTDYYKGDFVTVVDKKNGIMYDLQITSVTKSISNGVEHFDITFGWDNLRIKSLTDKFNNYVVVNVGGGSEGGDEPDVPQTISVTDLSFDLLNTGHLMVSSEKQISQSNFLLNNYGHLILNDIVGEQNKMQINNDGHLIYNEV